MTRLCLAGVLAYCSYAICRTPLLPLFARELGAGAAAIGLVMGASTITGILVKLPAGALSDHLGRRRLLFAGALVFAIMPFTYLTVSTLGLLIALRVLHGSATAIFGPVASATLSDTAPPAQRGRWLSIYSTAQNTGQAIAPIVAGYLIAAGRFDVAFLVAGLLGLTVPFIVAGLNESGKAPRRRLTWRELRHGVSEVASHRLILTTSVVQAAQYVLHGATQAFLPLYARDVIGLGVSELGWVFGAQTVTLLAVRPLAGPLSDRVSRRSIIVTGLSMTVIAVASLPLMSSRTVAIAAIVFAAGFATTTAAAGAFITDHTPRARYGAAHGVFGTIYDIGDALGPIGAGILVATFGYVAMFITISAIVAIVTMAFVVISTPRPRAPAT